MFIALVLTTYLGFVGSVLCPGHGPHPPIMPGTPPESISFEDECADQSDSLPKPERQPIIIRPNNTNCDVVLARSMRKPQYGINAFILKYHTVDPSIIEMCFKSGATETTQIADISVTTNTQGKQRFQYTGAVPAIKGLGSLKDLNEKLLSKQGNLFDRNWKEILEPRIPISSIVVEDLKKFGHVQPQHVQYISYYEPMVRPHQTPDPEINHFDSNQCENIVKGAAAVGYPKGSFLYTQKSPRHSIYLCYWDGENVLISTIKFGNQRIKVTKAQPGKIDMPSLEMIVEEFEEKHGAIYDRNGVFIKPKVLIRENVTF